MQKEENKKTPEESDPKVEILIVRHKQLFETLKNPRMMWRVLLSLFFIIVILFIGLVFVVLSIKSFYPYNAIQTNLYGATIMKNEDKEVVYWLFNTAEVWANSGIEVHENDEISIRASGASFSAIHHLIESAQKNSMPTDKWVDTDGQNKENKRDKLRAKYRISSLSNEGELLMQIIPTTAQNSSPRWINDPTKAEYLKQDNENIEIIGKGRERLRIKKDGILHFSVNDILLTDTIIEQMYSEQLDSIFPDNIKEETKSGIFEMIKSITLSSKQESITEKIGDLVNKNKEYFKKDTTIKYEKIGLMLGKYPGYENDYPLVNELVYYKQNGFKDAWFVDNVGSFLIVIEIKR